MLPAPIWHHWEFSIPISCKNGASRYKTSLCVPSQVFACFLISTGFCVACNPAWRLCDGVGDTALEGSWQCSSWSQAVTPPLASGKGPAGLKEGQAKLKTRHKWQRSSGTHSCGWEPHHDLLPDNPEDVFHPSAYWTAKTSKILGILLTSYFSYPSTLSLNSKS